MTFGVDENTARQEPRGGAEQASVFLAWPTLTLTFALIPVWASVIIVEWTGRSFADAAATVAEWLSNSDAQPRAEMKSGFGFLAVVATIVIGVAFSLPPGGVHALPKKNRWLLQGLTLAVTFALSLFSAAALWVVVWRGVTFDLLLLLLGAWLVSVVAGFVELRPPTTERVRAAKQEWERLRRGVEDAGFVARVTITSRQKVTAEIAYWSIPIVGVPFVGAVGLAFDYRGASIDPRAWGVVLILAWGAAVMSLGWRTTASFPPHQLSERLVSWVVRGIGMIVMLLITGAAVVAESYVFAVLSALIAIASIVLYGFTSVSNRLWFMRTIRYRATSKRLARAEEWYRTVLQALDDEEEREKRPCEDRRREPLIRIEVFPRGTRRRPTRRDS